MSFHFHFDRRLYFEHQLLNTSRYVIPFILSHQVLKPDSQVLEVGCGEGGVLKAFIAFGCHGVGVELDGARVESFCHFMSDALSAGKAEIHHKDIYELIGEQSFKNRFDLIVFKDVIEHIHDQTQLLKAIRGLLKPDGAIFLGFPPWQMPFGGHQQICQNKYLSRLPYIHLLPKGLYKRILIWFGESPSTVEALLEVRETGISIEDFEKITLQSGYRILKKELYLFNPIYELKFGIKPKVQFRVISSIPVLRNFLTTCVYYLIK